MAARLMSGAVEKKCSFREFDERSCVSTSVGDDQAALDEVCSQPSYTGLSCTLVWCHERCHKRDNQEVRHALAKATTLVCLKKANKFACWCQRQESPSYVLLTDWREVKPCMSFLDEVPNAQRPFMTIVLCDDPEAKIFARAVQWARSLGSESESVHVVRDLASVFPLLASLRGREAGSGASTPRASRMSSKASSTSCSSSCVSRMPSSASADAPAQGIPPAVTRCQFLSPVVALPELLLLGASKSEGFSTTPPPPAPTPRMVANDDRVEAYLKRVTAPFGNMSSLQLDQLLKELAESPYED